MHSSANDAETSTGWEDEGSGWSENDVGSQDGSCGPSSAAQPDAHMEAWFLMEFCNRGTLQVELFSI